MDLSAPLSIAPATTAPTATTTTTTTSTSLVPRPIKGFSDAELETFDGLCVRWVMTGAFLGDEELLEWWNRVDQEEETLRSECADIARTDVELARDIRGEAWSLAALIADTAPTTQPRPTATPTTTRPRPTGPGPTIQIDCGDGGHGWYEWWKQNFGYAYSGRDLVEWGMDYGDGKNYVVDSKAEADQDLFWHKYWAPASYNVRAWVIDSFGRRADASCTFVWSTPRASSNSGGNRSGDLDCEDIGYEHWVGNDDPHNLDGDGDGWACEGW